MRKPEDIEFTRAEVARKARQLWIAAGRPGSRIANSGWRRNWKSSPLPWQPA